MEFTCGRCVLSCLLVFQLFLLRCHRKSRWPRGIVALGTRLFQDLGVCYHYLGCLFRLNNCPFFHAIHATLIKVTSCHFPSNVVFSDLWTCHVTSFDGYKYYVIFVDHFTKYIWYYPLFRKFDVHSPFMTLKNLVKNYFVRSIKTLFTDNGGEFRALCPFLSSIGITHLTTPSHTLEHNGYSECCHRHIVETRLTPLHQASVPSILWHFAFAAAVYLINRMPKQNLNFSTSFEMLFKQKTKFQ